MTDEAIQPLRTGDRVRVRPGANDEWTEGAVVLASKNGKSIAVELRHGAIRTPDGGMFIGPLLLMIDYEKQTVEDLRGGLWEVEVSEEQATYSPTD